MPAQIDGTRITSARRRDRDSPLTAPQHKPCYLSTSFTISDRMRGPPLDDEPPSEDFVIAKIVRRSLAVLLVLCLLLVGHIAAFRLLAVFRETADRDALAPPSGHLVPTRSGRVFVQEKGPAEGIPVVLFMENYDINRLGYHDRFDNMTMINLDYGAALAAITIESVARAATELPPRIVNSAKVSGTR